MNFATLSFAGTSAAKKPLKQTTHFAVGEFDKARMERALSMETIELPDGLTREEKRKFLLEHSK
ncbi:MAG: hypothetical protein WCL34_06835 [Methylococcaceae bacterium]